MSTLKKNQYNFINKDKIIFKYLMILSIFFVTFSWVILQNKLSILSGIKGENVDGLLSEQFAFLFNKNISFNIIPIWNLHNNWVAYPYGINQSMQSWNIESCWFNYFGKRYINPNISWLVIHYIFSIGIQIYLLFFIFIKENFNVQKSAISVFIIVFCNFFAIDAFPAHYFYSIIHWGVIGIILDFLITRRLINNEQISLQLILLRIFVFISLLGNDIGYVGSIALTFLAINSIHILVLLIKKYKKTNIFNFNLYVENFKLSFNKNKLNNIILFILIFIQLYFTFTTFIQLYLNVLSINLQPENGFPFFNNPFKILQPYLPFFNPFNQNLYLFKGGVYKTDFAPGLSLFLIAVFSILNTNKKYKWLIFSIIFFISLFFLQNCPPFNFNFFKNIFWLKYIRINSRITLYFSTFIGLLFLNSNFKTTNKKIIFPILLLFVVEIYTFYKHHHDRKFNSYDSSFINYMNKIKKYKGEAIFDFPFCFVGGNGIGELKTKEKTCRLYNLNANTAGFQVFHEKKVFNYYAGRISEKQFDIYRNLNWHKIAPSEGDPFKSIRLSQCPSFEAFNYVKNFIMKNDFAGINIYPDLLPSDCVKEFYEIFGNPIFETKTEVLGRIQFIPKNIEWDKYLNVSEGKTIKFNCNCQ